MVAAVAMGRQGLGGGVEGVDGLAIVSRKGDVGSGR